MKAPCCVRPSGSASLALLLFSSCLLLLHPASAAFDYNISEIGGLSVTDRATEIPDVKTLFKDEVHLVSVKDLVWAKVDTNATAASNATASGVLLVVKYETFVNDKMVDSGTLELGDVGRELPETLEVGSITPQSKGSTTVRVVLTVDGASAETEQSFQTMRQGVVVIPLILLLVLAVTTHMVELSLLSGVFVGACMVAGNLNDGFKTTFDTFILTAITDEGHGFVYLFTLSLAGLVGIIEKSGGMKGFVVAVAKYATTSRAGQLITFGIGLLVFFDDYANTLLAGETMRPFTDTLFVSREKLSFIVDATAAPIASLTPISSWIGFEVNLIQTEIDRIAEQFGKENLKIETTGMGVFLQSIKYRYYPIFMILIMLFLIVARRDYGPMLVAERKAMVHKRNDGGDSSVSKKSSIEDPGSKPRPDTPAYWWNMIVPMSVLVFLIFWLLIASGEIDGTKQSILDKLQESDSYAALLWGTVGSTFLTMLFYFTQIIQNGRLVLPTPSVIRGLVFGKDASAPRFLMPMKDCIDSFLHGMARIFPALIILTLAWSVGDIMTSVGVDRLVSRWITDGLDPSLLPTLSFIISALMALATGTSWGTMSIMFPLLIRATYVSSNGDPRIVYSTVAGILSGAVAGDHASPISDTTVLSALACECQLMAHVRTQMPYAVVVSIVSILFGTLPYGRGAWHNMVGISLGTVALIAFVYLICKPIVNANGSYDIITEMYVRAKNDQALLNLKADTIAYYEERQGGLPMAPTTVKEKAVGSSNGSTDTPKEVAVEKAVIVEDPHGETMA